MDATCKVQDNIHVFRLVHNMCPGFWVHITQTRGFTYTKKPAEFTLCWLNYFLLEVAYHFFLMKKYFKNTSANNFKP